MSDATIVALYTGKSLPDEVRKAVESAGWKLNALAAKGTDIAFEAASADAIILVLEKGKVGAGENLIATIKSIDENVPCVAMVDSSSLEDAVAIMKAGAFDCFTFPLDDQKLVHALTNAIRLYRLTKRVYLLENQMGARGKFDGMIGQSQKMRDIFSMIQTVAKSNATVLIQGESGTGKELVAKALHRHSPREKKSFLDINCGAIPRELLENEMFGHERGAYTGADRRYLGSFERAHGGTLFLDEISEMDASLQVKLLRFLQERTFTRIGGSEQISVDVRIVTATNRDLAAEVRSGRFREDLYYRLNVVPILLPPLRERVEDIPFLAKHFLDKYCAKTEKIFLDFAPQVIEKLVAYEWPGNVRELENVIERIVVLHNDSRVKLSHLPPHIQSSTKKNSSYQGFPAVEGEEENKILPLDLVERYAIEAALRRCLGNVNEAAAKLRIGQATLYRKIKQYGLRL